MKKVSGKLFLPGVTLLVVVALSACATQQQETEKVYPYPFETARIEYELSGNVEGTITVLIKGDRAIHETEAVDTSAGGQPIHTKIIDMGDTLYQIDLVNNRGQKGKNPIYSQLQELPEGERMDFLTKLAAGAPEEGAQMPEVVEQKAVAGETCDLYNIEDFGEICLWNGIPLYSSMSIPEAGIMNTNTATSIQIDTSIPDSAFDIPSDVTITEVQ